MSPIDKHYLGEFKSFGLYYELLGELRDSKVVKLIFLPFRSAA